MVDSQPARPVTPTPPAPAYSPSFSYSPSDINAGLIARGVSPSDAAKLTAVTGAESNFGKSPISPPNKDGSRDYSLGQINSKAWPQLNPPGLVHAPLGQQLDAIVHVYNHQGLGAWTTYKNGAYRKYLNQVGSTAPVDASSTTTTTTTSLPPPPPPANVGDAIAMLNLPSVGGGKSVADNARGMFPDAPAPQVPQSDLQMQMAAGMGNPRQGQIAAQAQALNAALMQRAQQPLSWSTRPFGSNVGPQNPPATQALMGGQQIPMPGTTLNSMGNF